MWGALVEGHKFMWLNKSFIIDDWFRFMGSKFYLNGITLYSESLYYKELNLKSRVKDGGVLSMWY